MSPISPHFHRRSFLIKIMAGGLLSVFGLPIALRTALGMGRHAAPQGFQKIQGKVRVNGVTAQMGTELKPGDIITTGAQSHAVFIINTAVYLVRDNSRIELSIETPDPGKQSIIDLLRIVSGKLMAVSLNQEKRIVTPTANLGIRGTGIYVEADPGQTYVCTCYGTVDIQSKAEPGAQESVTASYHDAPRFVYASGPPPLITDAPVINHRDEELILLEALVGRQPPFVTDKGKRGTY